MKFTSLITVLAATISFSTASMAKTDAQAKADAKKIVELDTAKSSLNWLGKKVTGQHNGTINIKSGNIEVDGNKVIGGTFEIDMASITNMDVKDAEYHKKLVTHLNSEDFFSTAKFPTGTYKIKEVKEIKGNKDATHEVVGELTLKGMTHPLSFMAKIDMKDGKGSATGKATIDRTKYDIRYGSGKFFQNLGDKMIYDTFDVDFNLVTK